MKNVTRLPSVAAGGDAAALQRQLLAAIRVSCCESPSAIPAALLGHMGKHGPILVVESNTVPDRVRSYLEMVKPFPTNSRETILNHACLNHAWIIGDASLISDAVQDEIDGLMAVASEEARQ